MTTITTSTTSTTGFTVSSDTTGTLVVQTGATPTTAMTVSAAQVVNFANAPTIGGAAFPTGAMTLISTQTASNSASLAWTGLSGYNSYSLIFKDIIPANSSTLLYMQIGTGAGPTYVTNGYNWQGLENYGATTNNSWYGGNTSYFNLGPKMGLVNFAPGYSGFISITGATTYFVYSCSAYDSNGSAGAPFEYINGGQSSSYSTTAIKIYLTSGNITSGTASLYGISS